MVPDVLASLRIGSACSARRSEKRLPVGKACAAIGVIMATCGTAQLAAGQPMDPEPLPPPVPGDTVMAGPRPLVGKLRLGLPAIHHVQFAWRDVDSTVGSDHFEFLGTPLVGLEGGVEVYEWIALEVGVYLWMESGISQDFSGRVGIVPVVADGRDGQGTGWTLQLPLLIGYELYNVNSEVDGSPRNWLVHALNLRAGLDATYWGSAMGLTGRLVAVGGPALGKSTEADAHPVTAQAARGDDFQGFLGFDCTVGVAF